MNECKKCERLQSMLDKCHAAYESALDRAEKAEAMIAAAPDMLVVLKQIESEMKAGLGSSYGETREQVRRAIAKTEGNAQKTAEPTT